MMNSDACRMVGRVCWFVTGAASLAVGLDAMGMDILGMLHLSGLADVLRYAVGLAGLGSLVLFFAGDCG